MRYGTRARAIAKAAALKARGIKAFVLRLRPDLWEVRVW